MTSEKLERILSICSHEEIVKCEVIKNHDNNMWWPANISDKRMRLIIAGLSTRISYHMITTYQKVISELNEYSFEDLAKMKEETLSAMIAPLGLHHTRMTYIISMIRFIEKFYEKSDQYNNDELIELISQNVQGASYKVAQCCVLYMRGYYCGVMPVDSGMKDMLLPCIGFARHKGAKAHEILRRELEEVVSRIDLVSIVKANGYQGQITIPEKQVLTWWAHLVLIYFKRSFCNKHRPEQCPLCREYRLPCLCYGDRKI